MPRRALTGGDGGDGGDGGEGGAGEDGHNAAAFLGCGSSHSPGTRAAEPKRKLRLQMRTMLLPLGQHARCTTQLRSKYLDRAGTGLQGLQIAGAMRQWRCARDCVVSHAATARAERGVSLSVATFGAMPACSVCM